MSNAFGNSNPKEFSRRTLLRYSGTLAAAAAVGVSLAACSGPQKSTATATAVAGPKGNINAVVGYGSNQSWDPSQTASAFIMAANRHIYEGLVTTDLVTGAASPALGTALPANPGATEWTFTLRKGAKFHDGTPVTADDVVYSFNRALDPTVLLNEFFTGWLSSVEAVGSGTVKLKLAYPFPLGVKRLEMVKIVSKAAYSDWTAVATGAKVIGSGPYKVTQNNLGTNTMFEAFADYNGPLRPNFQTMNWFSITDPNALVAKVLSGAALVTDNVPTNNVAALKGAGMTVGEAKGMNNVFLMFNTSQKPFDDERVRQALYYAIDTDKLIKVALSGYGVAAQSFLPASLTQFTAASTVYKYNPAKAKQLLQAAGVPAGFKINLLATNTSYVVNALNVIQEGWQAAGLAVTLEPQPTASLFTKMDEDASYQVVAASSNPEQFGTDPDLLIRYNYTKGGLWMKYTKWDSSSDATALFSAMDAAARETNEAKRNKAIQANLDTIAKAAVIYPAVFVDMLTAWYPNKVTGVPALPIPGIDLRKAKLV